MTNNFWRRFWPPMAWAAVLFIQSSIPDLDPPLRLSSWDDKWAHVLIYIPLGFLLLRALHQNQSEKRKLSLFGLALLLGSAYGISDELHQYFTPGRSPDWRDWIADSIGVALGALLYFYFLGKKRARRHKKSNTVEPEIAPEA